MSVLAPMLAELRYLFFWLLMQFFVEEHIGSKKWWMEMEEKVYFSSEQIAVSLSHVAEKFS